MGDEFLTAMRCSNMAVDGRGLAGMQQVHPRGNVVYINKYPGQIICEILFLAILEVQVQGMQMRCNIAVMISFSNV